MGIELTQEEQKLFKEGKLDPSKIEEHRRLHPVHSVNLNEVDNIKKEIHQAMDEYKAAIQKNKDLYTELENSRKAKEVCRNKIADLRIKKKKILGIE